LTPGRQLNNGAKILTNIVSVPAQGKLMKILKDLDDLRFVAVCDRERGFVPLNIECRHCGGQIDPHSSGASLQCSCGHAARASWSEAQMHVFIADTWDALRPNLRSCPHDRAEDLLNSCCQLHWAIVLLTSLLGQLEWIAFGAKPSSCAPSFDVEVH